MGTPVIETRTPAKGPQRRLQTIFWLDVTLLVSFCAVQTVPFTGLVIHEWLGLVMVCMVFAHLLLSWSWISAHTRRMFAAQSARARVNYLLNLGLFFSVTAVVFSGILIGTGCSRPDTGFSSAFWRTDREAGARAGAARRALGGGTDCVPTTALRCAAQ
jgi:hypothetical protein